MKKEDIIKRLTEFNKAACEMFSLSFIEKLKGSGCTINWKRGEGFSTKLRGPDDESTKALCNDLRKFIQKNDMLKIEKLIPIYQSDLIQEEEKKLFNRSMSWYEKFKKRLIKVEINGKTYTYKELLEIFLYGKISHWTEETKEIHDNLEQMIPVYTLLKNEFILILHGYLRNISNFICVNKKVLEKLE